MNERSDWGVFSAKRWGPSARGKKPAASLRLEQLEDRLVPSGTPTVDLTKPGALGEINGALFQQTNTQPTGTGVIQSFVRLQAQGAKQTVEQGYNTGARPLQFDENKSPQFTRNLQLGELPTVNAGGVTYRVFLLDVNQKASQPLLSLDELRLYVGPNANLTGYDPVAHTLGGLSAVYDMDAGGDNYVLLDARITHGSGSGDMLLYVPDQAFTAAGATASSYVYLYSKFGVNNAGNSGFEEWAPDFAAGGQAVLGGGTSVSTTGVISGQVTDQATGAGLNYVQVFIDANNNGVLDAGETFTYTDTNGNYSFGNLATGLGDFSSYNVRVVTGDDWSTTTPVQTVDLTTANQTVTNVNFQLYTTTTPPVVSGNS